MRPFVLLAMTSTTLMFACGDDEKEDTGGPSVDADADADADATPPWL